MRTSYCENFSNVVNNLQIIKFTENTMQFEDQLAWTKFYDEEKKRKSYPPEKIELFNRLVAHTDNFFVIAAIGAFSPGYLMLITKELVPSFSLVKDNYLQELNWLIEKISGAISKTYRKKIIIFEHGNCACLGGLDRAHLHIMTINECTDNLVIDCINKALINRRAGINYVEINGHKLENIHDIAQLMDSSGSEKYKINGKQLLYEDINKDFDIEKWPTCTRKHVLDGGSYVYFKTNSQSTSFFTNKNFQTQLGRQIAFEIEKETNPEIKKMSNEMLKKNNYANIWKWQEFPFKENMLKTMKDLIPSLLEVGKEKNEYNFLTFEKK